MFPSFISQAANLIFAGNQKSETKYRNFEILAGISGCSFYFVMFPDNLWDRFLIELRGWKTSNRAGFENPAGFEHKGCELDQ